MSMNTWNILPVLGCSTLHLLCMYYFSISYLHNLMHLSYTCLCLSMYIYKHTHIIQRWLLMDVKSENICQLFSNKSMANPSVCFSESLSSMVTAQFCLKSSLCLELDMLQPVTPCLLCQNMATSFLPCSFLFLFVCSSPPQPAVCVSIKAGDITKMGA